ncbi:MAG: 6-phosphogluconolactonase [Xanthomonadales bacterium]|jgi:6-phosphogluconolactonase|nr:6-phosphogluconolactonase [Xanthomonadales bacterium]
MTTDVTGPIAPRLLSFDTREEACASLASEVCETLTDALAARGRATLVVSGGTSPVAFFRHLRRLPLSWERITVLPSDERVVPLDHADRNEAMIRRELLQGPASGASLRGLLPASGSTANLPQLAETLPLSFDAVVLGMGTDGHTASLFPGAPELEAALRSPEPLALLNVPRLGTQRVSLTPAALLATCRIDLLIFGPDKRAVYEAAAAGDDAGEYPVRCVLRQKRVPVRVFWAP